MSAGLIIPALFFCAVSIALLVFIMRSLLRAFRSPLDFWETWGLRRKQQLLLDYDRQRQVGNLALAARAITKAFVLTVPTKTSLLRSFSEHNYKALERFLSLAEIFSLSADQLKRFEDLESLLSERNRLLQSYGTGLATASKLERPAQDKSADWALSQYQKRLRQNKKELGDNACSIKKAINKCLEQLKRSSPKSDSLYH